MASLQAVFSPHYIKASLGPSGGFSRVSVAESAPPAPTDLGQASEESHAVHHWSVLVAFSCWEALADPVLHHAGLRGPMVFSNLGGCRVP